MGRPRIAWQIDMFGHSNMHANLFAQAGFDALVINRLHKDVKRQYIRDKKLEFNWETTTPILTTPKNKNNNHKKNDTQEEYRPEGVNIFTHVMYQHYSFPEGFDFESANSYGQINLVLLEKEAIRRNKICSECVQKANQLVV